MPDNPKISIIVPAYNAEKTIIKCVDSLLNQTYKNLEIILVDDCSTDNTAAMCEELSEKDPRVFFSSTFKNSGPSKTRNIGIGMATGDWIAFVDSDDWIDQETYEVAIQYANRYNAECIVWSYTSEYGLVSKEKHIYDGDMVFTGQYSNMILIDTIGPVKNRLAHPELLHSIGVTWNKLFKAETIQKNGIVYYDLDEIGIEDLFFSVQYFMLISTATTVYIDRCFYHYVKTDSLSVSNKYKPTYIQRTKKVADSIEKLFGCRDDKLIYMKALKNRIALSLINIGLNEIAADDGMVRIISRLRKVLGDDSFNEAFRQLEIEYLPFKWKIFFLCARFKFAFGIYTLLKAMSILMKKKD